MRSISSNAFAPRARGLSWRGATASVSAHALALGLLALWGILRPPAIAPALPAETPEPIAIEVSFLPAAPAPKTVDTAPAAKPEPKPAPAAPAVAKPAPVRPAEARTVRRAEPRPANPVPRPKPRAVQAHTPPKPTQAELLARRFASENGAPESEAARLARLDAQARAGAAAGAASAQGAPDGVPDTDASGMTGALASRQALYAPNPAYPPELERLGDEGRVRVRLTVAPDGTVSAIALAAPSGRAAFDRAALAAVRRWRFAPLPEGETGLQTGTMTIRFFLR